MPARRSHLPTLEQPEDHRLVALTDGSVAKVDMEDYERVMTRRWGVAGRRPFLYARTNASDRLYMHRFILGLRKGEQGDHKNGDTLDNRRSNLRKCSHSQNMWNNKGSRKNTSGFKGVSYHKDTGKFQAYITKDDKYRHLGLFVLAEDAARAYDAAALKLFGEFAKLNFPKALERP